MGGKALVHCVCGPRGRGNNLFALARDAPQLGEFYLMSSHRRQGLGSLILVDALAQADERRVETRLEFLKWNPVGQLYIRHGFEIVSESEIHFFAIRRVNAA